MNARVVLLMVLLAPCAAAAADGGFYLGLGMGGVQIEDQAPNPNGGGAIDFDSGRVAYRGFLGYQAKAARAVDLAAELGYVDFGRSSQTSQGVDLRYQLSGAELAGMVILNLRPIELFAKAGVLSWSADKNVGGSGSSSNGTDAFYGVGVGFNVANLGFRAEYDEYNVSSVDRLRTYSLSFLFRFY